MQNIDKQNSPTLMEIAQQVPKLGKKIGIWVIEDQTPAIRNITWSSRKELEHRKQASPIMLLEVS